MLIFFGLVFASSNSILLDIYSNKMEIFIWLICTIGILY